MIRNKVLVCFYVENGCNQDKGEASAEWTPVNFPIYDELFLEMIRDAIDEWLDQNVIRKNTRYEVIFAHVIERDGAGAVTSEYFEPVSLEHQEW